MELLFLREGICYFKGSSDCTCYDKAKKLPIFFFLILSIFAVIELNIPAYDIYSLYVSGRIQFNKTFSYK